MPNIRMAPSAGATNPFTIASVNRTYSASANSFVDVPDFDAEILEANGWIRLAESASTPGSPQLDQSFSQYVASLPLLAGYVFGSSASSTAGNISIRNATDLGNNFNPFEDFTGQQLIVSGLQRYQPFSSSGNFLFAPDHLSLTATVDAGGHVSPTVFSQATGATINLNGGANPIANLGLANTNGIQVGQLMASVYNGLYYVSAFVANTSVTFLPILGSPTAPVSYSLTPLIVFLPYYIATVTSTTVGTTITCAGGVPAGIVPGMFYSVISGGNLSAGATIKVVSTTGTTITLDSSVSVANGNVVVFTAPIRTGQIWTKSQYRGGGGNVVLAMELTCQLPHNVAGPQFTSGAVTATAYAALPPGGAGGAWPAYWLYSADDGLASYRDASEIDIFEFYYGATSDSRTYNGFTHGSFTAVNFVKNTNPFGGGTYGGGYFYFTNDLATAVHKFQLVWTKDALYRYIDGILIQAEQWRWGSLCPAQIGINMGIGSLAYYYAANLFFPYNDANFPMSLDVYTLKIWQA